MEKIIEIISKTIYPQFSQMFNLYLTKIINTGDRVIDNCLIVVINSIGIILLTLLYNLYTFLTIKYESDIINVDSVLKKYKKDDIISNYKILYNAYSSVSNSTNIKPIYPVYVIRYIVDFKIVDKINIHDKINVSFFKDKLGERIAGSQRNSYFTPVYKYVINNQIEYIFLVEEILYSNNQLELEKFLKLVYNYSCEFDKINIPQCERVNSIYEYTENTSQNVFSQHINLGKVNKKLTFDNIHFEQKELLLKWVDLFINNNMYPKELPLCNKLGILLHGKAGGTGKTGSVSALANKLNRDVILINSFKIQNKNKLREYMTLNKDKSIFVFDEFDYLLDDIDIKESSSCLFKQEDSKDPIDTRFLLQLLDGVGDETGRVIIATTNNPEKINPLFLRAGRFDVKLKLGFCTFDMFLNIVKCKYSPDLFNKQNINLLLKKNITPLILINNLVTSDTYDDLIILLNKLPKIKE